MRSPRVVLLVTIVSVLVYQGDCRSTRMKRRLDEFGQMILLTTDRNPLDFNGYGNWCGYGGAGETVDEIDQCCKTHDLCYAHVNRDECKTWLKYRVYTTQYRWSAKQGNISCKDEDACPKTLCECDRAAAVCFGDKEHLYDQDHKHSAIMKGVKKLFG